MGIHYANKEERKILADKSEKAFGRRGHWLKRAKKYGATILEIEEAMDVIIEARKKMIKKATDKVIDEQEETLKRLEDKNDGKRKKHKSK